MEKSVSLKAAMLTRLAVLGQKVSPSSVPDICGGLYSCRIKVSPHAAELPVTAKNATTAHASRIVNNRLQI